MSTEARKIEDQPRIKWVPGSGKSFGVALPSLLASRRAPYYVSDLGALFEGDCLEFLQTVKDGVVDTVFADPPFNLGKQYGARANDNLPDEEYVQWCQKWLSECVRVLKPGGSIFVYNLPKWNVLLGADLAQLGL